MDRRDVIMAGLRLEGLGLEIGAGYSPLAAGRRGVKVRTLDHLPTEELVAKYARMGVDTTAIQPVDYVWNGEPYKDLVGNQKFDWIVASHVIEHVPDLIAFLNQCADILTEDGVLTLAAPDRRYTFDYYRPVTGLREIIDAHLARRTVSSPGCVAEHFLNLARLDGQDTWDAYGVGEPAFVVSPAQAAEKFETARSGVYLDVHAWVFTESGFRMVIEDLHQLGLTHLRECGFHAAMGCEFFVQLSKRGSGPGVERWTLAGRALAEQAPLPASRSATPDQAWIEERSRLEAANASLRAELEAIRASNSWCLTAPLRALRGG